jgi:hypothetical protein
MSLENQSVLDIGLPKFNIHDGALVEVGGLMLSHSWYPVINMLSNQEAGLMQQALDTSQQLSLASAQS